MRVVVDTNVLVSALILPHGRVGPVLLRLPDGAYTLLYSQPLLEELVDVLNRPRIRHKYELTDEAIETLISLILLRGEAVAPEQRVTVCRDPKENKFFEVALAGGANLIVSGHQDLLALHPFASIPILRPADFLQMLEDAG